MEANSTANGGRSLNTNHSCSLTEVLKCLCGRSTIAVWELGEPEDIFNARLTIKRAGLPIVTEIVTTLTLLRMAQALNW